MRTPVYKRFRVVIIYHYGREIELETNVDITAAEENGEMFVDLEDGRRKTYRSNEYRTGYNSRRIIHG